MMIDESQLSSYSLSVFNRWGEIVFESNDFNIGWDGTYDKKACPNGTYTWKIFWGMKQAAEEKEFSGHVNLLR